MSATATMAVASPGTLTTASSTHCCPNCGFGADLPPFEEAQAALLNSQKQISDLQAQVRLLNQKASAAVDRWADYEDELARLRARVGEAHRPASRGVTLIHSSANPAPQAQQQQPPPSAR